MIKMRNKWLIDEFLKRNNLKYDDKFIVKNKNTGDKRIFKITSKDTKVKLSYVGDYDSWYNVDEKNEFKKFLDCIFCILFNDEYEIYKPPYYPKKGEIYYFIDEDGVAFSDKWDGPFYYYDKLSYLIGNCFKTEEEALKNKDKVLEILQRETPLVDLN